jgi:hypothetical protein
VRYTELTRRASRIFGEREGKLRRAPRGWASIAKAYGVAAIRQLLVVL